MKYQKEEKEGLDVFVYHDYTNQELREFEKELEVYKITKTLENGIVISIYDELRWYKDNGGLGINGGVILGDSPVKFEVLRHKLWSLYKAQGRREYAQKMNAQETKKDVEEFTEVLQQKLSIDCEVNPFRVK